MEVASKADGLTAAQHVAFPQKGFEKEAGL